MFFGLILGAARWVLGGVLRVIAGGTMYRFDGILEALIIFGVLIGLGIGCVVWVLGTYVFPHIHLSWS